MAIGWMCLRCQYGGANDVVDFPGGGQFLGALPVDTAPSSCTPSCTGVENTGISGFARRYYNRPFKRLRATAIHGRASHPS